MQSSVESNHPKQRGSGIICILCNNYIGNLAMPTETSPQSGDSHQLFFSGEAQQSCHVLPSLQYTILSCLSVNTNYISQQYYCCMGILHLQPNSNIKGCPMVPCSVPIFIALSQVTLAVPRLSWDYLPLWQSIPVCRSNTTSPGIILRLLHPPVPHGKVSHNAGVTAAVPGLS